MATQTLKVCARSVIGSWGMHVNYIYSARVVTKLEKNKRSDFEIVSNINE